METLTDFVADCFTLQDVIDKCSTSGLFYKKYGNYLVISAHHYHCKYDKIYHFECNGVILSRITDTIAIMARTIWGNNPRATQKFMPNADYYPIIDGTVINIYWNGKKWCIGTTRGVDVCDISWFGAKTFSECFQESSGGFNLDDLDKNYTYNICMRNHDYHWLLSDPAGCTLLQKIRNSDGYIDKVEYIADNKDVKINSQQPLTVKTKEDYRKLIDCGKKSIENYWQKESVNYGFIVRNREFIGFNTVCFYESAFYKKIKNMIYNVPRNIKNRKEYVILRNYICFYNRELFMTMFPQFNNFYLEYRDLFIRVKECIANCLRNETLRREYADSEDNAQKIAYGLAVKLENMKINKYDISTQKIISDYVNDVNNLNYYYGMLYGEL